MSTNPNPFGSGGSAVVEPYQFLVSAYGAKGNGKQISDATITSGQAIVHSASQANFTQADVGKQVIFCSAGTAPAPLVTTILSVQSATQCTLNANAGATVASAGNMIYGTDDTSAINSAVTAAVAYAQASFQSYAEVLFPAANYMVAGPTSVAHNATYSGNSQIPLPVIGPGTSTTGPTVPKITLALVGLVQEASAFPLFKQSVPQLDRVTLVSTLTGQAVDGTWGAPSVVGGPNTLQGYGTGGGSWKFSNMLVVVNGIQIASPLNPTVGGFDFRGVAQASIQSAAAIIADTQQTIYANAPSNSWTTGILMPQNLNNDNCFIKTFTCYGYYYGASLSSHVSAQRLTFIACFYGFFVQSDGNDNHSIVIDYISCENINTAMQAQTGGPFPSLSCTIGSLDCEGVNTFGSGGAHIQDGSNVMSGTVYVNDSSGVSAIIIQGAANIEVLAMNQKLGPWASAPAAPASGTAQQNTSWRPAQLYASSTVPITGISVGPVSGTLTALGLTAAAGVVVPFRVPSGHWYSITAATGTQTVKWVLD